MRIDLEGTACDSEAARLLPWLVNGTLAAEDAARVDKHVEHCGICRADLERERAVRALLKTDGTVEYAPQAGLAKTLARIDELTREAPSVADEPASTAGRRVATTQWLTAAVIVQAIGLGVLGGAYLQRPATPRYETLSTPAPAVAGGHVRAVFSASMTVGELKSLLDAQHLLILAGPSDAGVYTLGAAEGAAGRDRIDGMLAGLRADARVLFAEPASAEAAARR